jgi:alkylhydroperoxidase family enzyme
MAFIDYISYDEASPELRKLYEKYGGPNKTPANVVRIAGPQPKVMDAHIEFYRALMGGQLSITPQQREMIAVVTSGINHCHY